MATAKRFQIQYESGLVFGDSDDQTNACQCAQTNCGLLNTPVYVWDTETAQDIFVSVPEFWAPMHIPPTRDMV